LKGFAQQQEDADDGERAKHREPNRSLLLGLELSAQLDPIVAGQFPK
jgi:hypothetical protein